jgi:phosphoglycolate phosphatase-like HAD superfamily hydrolase
LIRPYPAFAALLRRRAGEVELAIATAKDRASVRALLSAWGLADLFGPERVLDKETGVSKVAHLEHLQRALGLAYPELTFVEDKVSHLESVAPLGVRCALAAWGYNGAREARRARERGFLVCELDDVEAQIFS